MKNLISNLQILKQSGATTTDCSCNTCKSMCKECPCIGTPSDIEKLIDAGYKDKLCMATLGNPFVINHFKKPIDIIGIQYDMNKKQCVMLDDNGLCSLHDLGLKPLEGKVASCKKERIDMNAKSYISICEEWIKVFKHNQ